MGFTIGCSHNFGNTDFSLRINKDIYIIFPVFNVGATIGRPPLILPQKVIETLYCPRSLQSLFGLKRTVEDAASSVPSYFSEQIRDIETCGTPSSSNSGEVVTKP